MSAPVLRATRIEDAAAIAAIYAPYVENTGISFETVAPSPAEMGRRIEEIWPMYPSIVCEVNGEILGYACAHAYAQRAAYGWSAESSVYIAENARGQGLGRMLYRALEGLLAKQGVHSLYALVTHPNPASEAFHTAMGYEKQGFFPNVGFKLGKWLGVSHYCKVLLPCEGTPAPLTPFAKLDKTEVEAILRAAAE